MIKIVSDGLSYDDVLLIPKYSTVNSRSDVDVSVTLKGFNFSNPIIPANMKTITGEKMASTIISHGGLAILHRFMPIREQLDIVKNILNKFGNRNLGVSIGIQEEDFLNCHRFLELGVQIICIDVAHADSEQCISMTKRIRELNKDILLIVGNVSTSDGAERLWRAGADVKIGQGPGCFSAGTRILMAGGYYKNIEDIIPGDYVINKNGNPVKVLNAFSTGIKQVSKLRNNCFYKSTLVTPDHQFWVGDLNSVSKNTLLSRGYRMILDKKSKTIPKQSKYKWKEFSNLKQDVCLMPKNVTFNMPETFSVELNKRVSGNSNANITYNLDSIITPSYESGYLFGTFLGDGNAVCTVTSKKSHIGSVRWSFGLNEQKIANKLSKCIFKIFGKKPVTKNKQNIIQVIFYYKPLADFLNTWGKRSHKKIPQNLLSNNKKYLKGIYDGLLDSDGHYAKDGRKTLSNTSPYIIELFNVVSYLINNLWPSNSKVKTTAGGLKNCNINNCKQPYRSQVIKNGKVRLTKNYQVIRILEREDLDLEVPVYDITVDCDTHSFIANNMIVHNSLCSTRIETGNGVPQFTALMEVAELRERISNPKCINLHDITHSIYIIADGGIKNSGDCVKSLCLADMVMAGNLFAGCDETPGDTVMIDGKSYKEYNGSSTHKTSHIEGVESIVPAKGTFKDVLTKLLEGLRSGLAYQGAHNLKELKERASFIKITPASLRESHPHDVILK